jgi:hypothetical protein
MGMVVAGGSGEREVAGRWQHGSSSVVVVVVVVMRALRGYVLAD